MKILYGVPSEGMGHATRSRVIIQHLIESGHTVQAATSDRAFDFLEKAFPGCCVRIEGLHLKYEPGGVDKSASAAHILTEAPEGIAANVAQYIRMWKHDDPDAVISDFESFTYLFAKLKGIPLLSIDNMQVINRCNMGFEVPDDEMSSYRIAKAAVKAKVPYCSRYLISAFFNAPPIKPHTRMIPPILRNIVLETKANPPPKGDHILVYQTASAQDDLITELQKVTDHPFLVYGLNREAVEGNVTLRKFSEEGFVKELASARAVVTNGGFSLISEAVYLHRPVCSFPLGNQFEQYVNGAQIEKMGYGRRFTVFSSDAIKAFLYDLGRFTETISTYVQDGNVKTFHEVDEFLEDVENGVFPEDE